MDIEEEFSILVLSEAKKIFGPVEQRYLGFSRMEKLVAFVAEEIDYEDLTRGWYKYGLFAPAAWITAKDYATNNLKDFEIPTQKYRRALELFESKKEEIQRSIYKLKSYFVSENEKFYEWVYSRAPAKFRNFYFAKMRFQKQLDAFNVHLELNQKHFLEEDYLNLISYINDLYRNVFHVDDEKLNIFHEYMDLLEMALIKIKNLNFTIDIVQKRMFNKIVRCFNPKEGDENDLFIILVPFKETLKGKQLLKWASWMDDKSNSVKYYLIVNIPILYEQTKEVGLLPSADELYNEVRGIGHEKSIRELLKES